MNSTPKAPLWSKTTQRILDEQSPPSPMPVSTPANGIPPEIFTRLGLKPPPPEPSLLGPFIISQDAADAKIEADGFARGIRRAVRLHLALQAGLHKRERLP